MDCPPFADGELTVAHLSLVDSFNEEFLVAYEDMIGSYSIGDGMTRKGL
jgi:hypothetical protein